MGNMGKVKNISPYPPNFRRIPANNTEPAKGASTWAWGSHMWNGNIGIFTAIAIQKDRKHHFCVDRGKLILDMKLIFRVPTIKYNLIMAKSINRLLINVKKNK